MSCWALTSGFSGGLGLEQLLLYRDWKTLAFLNRSASLIPRKSAKVNTTDSPGATLRAGMISPSEFVCSGPPDAITQVQLGP